MHNAGSVLTELHLCLMVALDDAGVGFRQGLRREEIPPNVFSPLCLRLGQYFVGIRVTYQFHVDS